VRKLVIELLNIIDARCNHEGSNELNKLYVLECQTRFCP